MNGGKDLTTIEETSELPITPASTEKQSSWYLVTGLILGLILGLVYAWVINPVVYEFTVPANLNHDDKDTYRSTIAQVYTATGDLERAKLRLDLLEDDDLVFTLGAQAQRWLADGNAEEARALALLASVLQMDESPSAVLTPTVLLEPVSATATQGIPTQTLPVPTPTP